MEDIDYVRLNYGAVFSSGSRPSERASERAPRRCDATPRAGSKERAEAGEGRKSQRTDFVFPVATLISLRTRIFLPPSRHFLPFSFSTVPIHSPPREWTTVVYEPTSFPIDGHLLTPLDRAIYISRLVSIRIVSINGVKKSSIRTFLSSFSFSLLLLPSISFQLGLDSRETNRTTSGETRGKSFPRTIRAKAGKRNIFLHAPR